MNYLTCMSEITHMPTLKKLVYTFDEDSCADVCEQFGAKGCVGCPIQEAINELYDYQRILFDPTGKPRVSLGKLETLIIEGTGDPEDPSKFEVGELVSYQNGVRTQIGKVKSLEPDGAFVYYHEGETAAKTPYRYLHKVDNAYCISASTLGREDTY